VFGAFKLATTSFINLLFRAIGAAFTVFLILDSNMELNKKLTLFSNLDHLFAEILATVVDAK